MNLVVIDGRGEASPRFFVVLSLIYQKDNRIFNGTIRLPQSSC